MLSRYRILDFTRERNLICGQILSDLGAEVIHVESPETSVKRSFVWEAHAKNSQSVVIDFVNRNNRADSEFLYKLIEGTDFFIEDFSPGYFDDLKLGYSDLKKINPQIIYISLSPFGQNGPKARYAATDLTIMAASGLLHLSGAPTKPPLRISEPQADFHASAEAAGAALIALQERHRSGIGQQVDVSAQQAVNLATLTQMGGIALGDEETVRSAGGMQIGGVQIKLVWEAKDGHVAITFFFGDMVGPYTRRLMEWVYEEGGCDSSTRDKDWEGYVPLLVSGEETQEEFSRVLELVTKFVKNKTKAELFKEAQKRNLLLVPVSTIPDCLQNEQLQARKYWQKLKLSKKEVVLPGPFIKLSEKPIKKPHRAPKLGAHTDKLRKEPVRKPAPPPPSPVFGGVVSKESRNEKATTNLPLSGLKVLDFMWVQAGPTMTRVLADYGATIIRVETPLHPEVGRGMHPFHDGNPGPENSAYFGNMNAGKLGLTLDMNNSASIEVVRDLVCWADVVCESFSPKAFRRWGLEYEELRKLNPEIIMLSSCLFGQTGPYSLIPGFGTTGAAITGYVGLVGERNGAPTGPFGAITDAIAPRLSLAALLAALEYRASTGKGQYLDQSQVESALHFLSTAFVRYTFGAGESTRNGNRDSEFAPHGVFPSRGEDEWIAIAIRNDTEWEAFCNVIDMNSYRAMSIDERHGNADLLESVIGLWTQKHTAKNVELKLQDIGIPSAVLLRGKNAMDDQQLQYREHFATVPHPVHGTTIIEGSRFKLSRTPAILNRPAPMFGQHNSIIMSEFLKYDDEKIASLAESGVFAN